MESLLGNGIGAFIPAVYLAKDVVSQKGVVLVGDTFRAWFPFLKGSCKPLINNLLLRRPDGLFDEKLGTFMNLKWGHLGWI